MAVQRAEKSKSSRTSEISVILSFVVMCAVIAFACGLCLVPLVNSYLVANLISFLSTGAVAFALMHFIFSNEMSQFDSRVLHELAKRGLVEVGIRKEDLENGL